MIKIAVVNESTVVTDAQCQQAVTDIQTQIYRDFYPAWGTFAVIAFYPKGVIPPKDFWQMVIFDNSDQAGALGYHDVDSNGIPIGKVFAKDSGLDWTVTLSHETLEMIGDELCNTCAMDANNKIYAFENCDAVENNTYMIGSTKVSDFVYPAWFYPQSKSSEQFDHLNICTAPFQIAKGGYIGIFDPQKGWTEIINGSHSDARWKIRLSRQSI